tara:strand:+ start:321 stop:2219 length:1899 start_codon:yes stop_codon:yes gene_type:complete
LITASVRTAPPGWALIQRDLFDTLAEAARAAADRYSLPDGTPTFTHDVDDVYESRAGRGLLYALGGADDLLDLHHQDWTSASRLYDQAGPGREHAEYVGQLRDGYYNLGQAFEWFHQGEGNQSLYEFGVADPHHEEQARNSSRFADLLAGPNSANYDAAHRVIRSPFPSSAGPLLRAGDGWGHGDATNFVRMILAPGYGGGGVAYRASLFPIVDRLEDGWWNDKARAMEIVRLFDHLILDGDTPTNLTATGLVTHAFLYTGQERYRRWVLDYTEAWMERIAKNDGMLPDNVGPTGQIGEHREGQWWGGLYGWNSRWAADINFGGLTVAAECATLISGDLGYLDLLRSQLVMLLENARTAEDGRLEVPKRYGPEGWIDFAPPRLLEFAHLYHASLDADDLAMIEQLRSGAIGDDWGHIVPAADRRIQACETARYEYYADRLPDWPERILRAEGLYARAHLERILADSRTHEQLLEANEWPPNPVVTKGLTQVTTGSPQTVYNGGLLRSTVRYWDRDRQRPGLPQDVAALVVDLAADRVGVELVNTHSGATRQLAVQAGAFGEHRFTTVEHNHQDVTMLRESSYRWLREIPDIDQTTQQIDAPMVEVCLPPGTSIRMDLGLHRFCRTPSYAPPK